MSLTITLIQPDLAWEDKTANLHKLESSIERVTENTEVVILPEMFSTGFSMNASKLAEKMDGPTLGWMRALAAKRKIIITGSLIIEDQGQYFNRLIWMLPNGHFGWYDKRHLFAYGGEHQIYTAGNKRLIASVKGWRINLLICYDLRFPVWSRQSPVITDSRAPASPGEGTIPANITAEYELLIYVANWPGRRSIAWKSLLPARAIENQCFVAGVNRVGVDGNNINYSGESMLVNPMGEVTILKSNEEDCFTITLDREKLQQARQQFPFLKDADLFTLQ